MTLAEFRDMIDQFIEEHPEVASMKVAREDNDDYGDRCFPVEFLTVRSPDCWDKKYFAEDFVLVS